MDKNRKFLLILLAFISVIGIGVYGYATLLNVSFIDALYMTAITISTVGYGEVGLMTSQAKLFTIFIIFSGLSVVGYGFTSIVAFFFEGELKDAWRRRRMETRIKALKNHYIVCGAGEVGQTVIEQFQINNLPFVVLEKTESRVEELREEDVLVIKDDATSEDALIKAGINQAKGIVCTLATDADNVFTVLTARQLNEDIYIIAKAIEKNAHKKLKKAGANNTISPNEIGGRRIAAMLIRPSVISFLDIITQADDVILDLEEVTICSNSDLVGLSLREAKIPEKTGLIILAIKGFGDKKLRFNPKSDEVLKEGDTMIAMGRGEQVDILKKIACDDYRASIL
ncbi:MAG: potassium channel protein [Dethiosulfatibacter sp.]|nr:potassium channel protein [Dethiosulfatibacter sp.]